MAYKMQVANLTLGGDGRDNPIPLTIANYRLDSSEQLLFTYQVDVIAPLDSLTYQVTALARTDQQGRPMLQPTDVVAIPCPPFC